MAESPVGHPKPRDGLSANKLVFLLKAFGQVFLFLLHSRWVPWVGFLRVRRRKRKQELQTYALSTRQARCSRAYSGSADKNASKANKWSGTVSKATLDLSCVSMKPEHFGSHPRAVTGSFYRLTPKRVVGGLLKETDGDINALHRHWVTPGCGRFQLSHAFRRAVLVQAFIGHSFGRDYRGIEIFKHCCDIDSTECEL